MDNLDLSGVVNATSNITNGIMDALLWILLILVTCAIIYFIWFILQHKHKVRVRVMTGGKDVIRDDRARTIKDGGAVFWKLLKLRETVPPPPPEALFINKRGVVGAECYYTQDGNIEWISSKTPLKLEGKTYYENFEPLTTKQRTILVGQITKAMTRKKKSWSDVLKENVPLMIAAIMVISMFVFWGDITQPTIQVLDTSAKITADQGKTVQLLYEMIEDKQIFVAQETTGGNDEPPN